MFIRILSVFALIVMASSLSGCGSISTWLADTMADHIPAWAGGLPPDTPPRPGTREYDEWMKERGGKQENPAPPKDQASSPDVAPGSALKSESSSSPAPTK
jgi:hypothetical protein